MAAAPNLTTEGAGQRRPVPAMGERGGGPGRVQCLAAVVLMVLSACGAPSALPSRSKPPAQPPPTGAPSVQASALPADVGWHVLLGSADIGPSDRAGFQALDATLYLRWSGPGLTDAPGLGASITGATGEVLPLEATVFGDSPLWVPEGLAVQAGIAGDLPDGLADPVLHVFSDAGTAFHEAKIDLRPAPAGSSAPPMPPSSGASGLEIPVVLRVTPSVLTVSHGSDATPIVFVRHGSRSIQYGGEGDVWDVTVGVTVEALGSDPVDLSRVGFELFDQDWAQASAEIRSGPDASPDRVPPGATRSLALHFQTESEPRDLRLVLLALTASGPPTASAVAGYDASSIADGRSRFEDLLKGLDAYQKRCVRQGVPAGEPASIGTSLVGFAGAIDEGSAIIAASDTYLDGSGQDVGTGDDTYVLARGGGGWKVTSVTAGAPDPVSPC